MNAPKASMKSSADDVNDADKPLDPATEKVRKKLVRFSAVFMGLNIVALMAVLAAIVYRIGGYGEEVPADPMSAAPVEPGIERLLDVPDGSRITAASRNGNEVTLTLELPGGGMAVWFFDIASGQVTGKLAIE